MRPFNTTLLLVLAAILGLGSGCSKERKKSNHIAKAESYLQKGQYQRAEIELINAARIPPDNARVYGNLGEVCLGQGRWYEAYLRFRRAAELEPANPDYRFQMAALELDLSAASITRSNAFHAAQAVLQHNPTNARALLVLSRSIYSTNSLNSALQLLDTVPAGAKESPAYHTARGNALLLSGAKFREALQEFQAALKQDTNYAAAYESLATLERAALNRRGEMLRLKQASEAAPHRSRTRLRFPDYVFAVAETNIAVTNLLSAVRPIVEATTTEAPDFVPGWVALAKVNRLERKYSEATANLQKVTAIQPMNREALFLRAEVYADQNNLTNALAQYQKAAAAFPKDPSPLIEMARLQIRANQLANAAASIKNALSLHTNNSEALVLLARLNLRNGNYAQAMLPLVTVATNRPSDPEPRLLMAYAYARQGQGEKAMEQWRILKTNVQARLAHDTAEASKLVQRRLTNAAALTLAELSKSIIAVYNAVATNQIQTGFTNAAADTLLQLADFGPTNTALQVQVAARLAAFGKYAESRRLLERSANSSTNAIIAQSALADLDVREKKWDSAKQRVKKQLEQLNAAGLWSQLGFIHAAHANEIFRSSAEVKRYIASPNTVPKPAMTNDAAAMAELREAEAALKKALDLDPEITRARDMLASLYQGTGRADETIQMMDAFLSETNTAAVQQQKAILLEQQGEFEQAAAAYEEALELDPNLYVSLNNLAALYTERIPKLEEALPLAERAYKLAPRSPQVQDTLGWILFKRGEYQRARDLLEEASRGYQGNPEVMYHLGMAHYMMGGEQAALQALTAALKLAENPNQRFSAKSEALRALEILKMDPNTAGPEARALLEKRLAENSRDGLALVRLAAVDERAGSWDGALKGYEQALAQNANNWQALYGAARVYANHRSDTRKALDLATRARTLNPREPSLAHFLGTLAYKAGDHKSANTLLNEAANAPSLSQNPQVQFDFALAACAVGRVETATEAMMRAAQTASFGKVAEAKAFVAAASAATNRAQAVQFLPEAKKLLASNAEHLPALMVVAVAQEAEPGVKEAARSYSAILAKYPQFAPASRNLAVLSLLSLSDPQSALTHAAKAREAYPQDPVLIAVTELARHHLKQRADLTALERVSRTSLPEGIQQEISRVLAQSRQAAKKS